MRTHDPVSIDRGAYDAAVSSPPLALVTGGAVRVGRGIVSGLVDAGYRVWIHCHRSIDEAQTLADQHGDAVIGIHGADLSQPDARAALARAVGPRLDLLVNNAASFERGPFESRTDDDLRRVLELNLVAPLSLVRACLPALRASPSGNVVNIVDLGARNPWAGYLDHSISKAALEAATRGLAAELAPLRVNAVAPGTVDWPADGRAAPDSEARQRLLARIPRGRIGTPDDVAQAVCFLAGASHISGHTLVVDGGSSAALGGTHA